MRALGLVFSIISVLVLQINIFSAMFIESNPQTSSSNATTRRTPQTSKTGSKKLNNSNTSLFYYITREGWGAKAPKLVEYFEGPARFVIIHHSFMPEHCTSSEECIKATQSIQSFHMDDRGWNDIGYTFAVGGDGMVYQGRGFQVVGAHAPGYNSRSVGICVIGDWRFVVPPQEMLDAVHALIKFGIQNGNIAPDYKLLGHRQVRNTECPGDAFYNTIQQWPHWENLESIFKPLIIPNNILN